MKSERKQNDAGVGQASMTASKAEEKVQDSTREGMQAHSGQQQESPGLPGQRSEMAEVVVEPAVETTGSPSARIEAPDGPCRIVLTKDHETGERSTAVGRNCTLQDYDDLMEREPDKMQVEGEKAQMPSPAAQEPSPAPVEAEPSPESSPPACEVRYKRNEAGGFDLWVGEGCSKEDLASISKGQAQVNNVTLECAEKWEKAYGVKSEPGADADRDGDASLSGTGEPILTRRTVTRKEQYDVLPEIVEEEVPAQASAKKKGRK